MDMKLKALSLKNSKKIEYRIHGISVEQVIAVNLNIMFLTLRKYPLYCIVHFLGSFPLQKLYTPITNYLLSHILFSNITSPSYSD